MERLWTAFGTIEPFSQQAYTEKQAEAVCPGYCRRKGPDIYFKGVTKDNECECARMETYRHARVRLGRTLYKIEQNTNLKECVSECAMNPKCRAATYHSGFCYMHNIPRGRSEAKWNYAIYKRRFND